MHRTPQPALALSHQPKHMHCIICIPYTRLHMRIKHQAPHAYTCSMPVYKILHHFHCEHVQSVTAKVHEVSLRACAKFYCERGSVFETLVQAHLRVQIRSHARNGMSAVPAELRVCSYQSSEYVRSETLLSQHSFAVQLCSRSVASSALVAKL